MKTFVIGDIHGGCRALTQCLQRSSFDKDRDTLISLGDIADGWSETPECVDKLLTIKNLIAIRGNHDVWCWNWFTFGQAPIMWTSQGGQATLDSYIRTGQVVDQAHKDFWDNQIDYYIDDENRLFVHGGFYESLEKSKNDTMNIPRANDLHWDRNLWDVACSGQPQYKHDGSLPKILRAYKGIFIGHTALKRMKPVNASNVWNLDTGGGFSGKLTIMDVDTEEYWQSDSLPLLYPDEMGRR